ncbi:MAG: transcriptional regulator, partial [Alistipes sp.]|nr:transcriptional regulator [Alistipes sp.]
MAFDYKKEYRDLYMPKASPVIVDVPEMKFVAVNGVGNPNDPDGEYQRAIGVLYPVAYAIK